MKTLAPRPKRPTETAGARAAAQADQRGIAIDQQQQQEAIAGSLRQQNQPFPARLAAPRRNTTGLPDKLKAGVEHLSGHSLDDVQVHYNSAQPAQLQALAYAQGTDIHLGPGQEQHLPHEAWHIAQQKQGRVQATMQLKGAAINDDAGLETEADIMGQRAAQVSPIRVAPEEEELAPIASLVAPKLQKKAATQPQPQQHKSTRPGSRVLQKYGVIQRGGGRSKEAETTVLEEIASPKRGLSLYYTKGAHHHVEAWADKKQIAVVDIETHGDNTILHTHSDESGGMGNVLVGIAIKAIAQHHCSGDGSVILPMGGGAVVKLMASKLSKVFGDLETHKQAELAKQRRVTKDKTEKQAKPQDPDMFDARFLEEHMLHNNAILAGPYADQITFEPKISADMTPERMTGLASTPDAFLEDPYYLMLKKGISKVTVTIPNQLFVQFANQIDT
ncbi:DUF4157 domain-containing protein [Hymenobacter elongatus]|uniref:DUF4157 domain-containing protein n=2 Tax=Hymenobacter elongatus TaxID=877208 RepID=A0A4Z0PFY5_9BACT|nr:DUF4157 domain-containing protein [Hymenobacter elongatus]